MLSAHRTQFMCIWNSLGFLWLWNTISLPGLNAMSGVWLWTAKGGCWVFSEAKGICWHSQGLSPRQTHAGEEPRPRSDNDDFFTWYEVGVKLRNFSEPTRGDNVTKLKKYLKIHWVSFPTLLKTVAKVPLPSTGAQTSPIRGRRAATFSGGLVERETIKKTRNKRMIHPLSFPKSSRPESLHVQREINWKVFINNLRIGWPLVMCSSLASFSYHWFSQTNSNMWYYTEALARLLSGK